MKKLLILATAISITVSFAACGGEYVDDEYIADDVVVNGEGEREALRNDDHGARCEFRRVYAYYGYVTRCMCGNQRQKDSSACRKSSRSGGPGVAAGTAGIGDGDR